MIAQALKKAREDAGLTQLELSKAVNISVPTISRYESGEREPKASDIATIAKVLNVNVADFFDGGQTTEDSISDTTAVIGEHLKQCREAANKLQKDVAKFLGVSVDTIWRWENNKGVPSLSQALALAKFFNTSISVLSGEDISSTNAHAINSFEHDNTAMQEHHTVFVPKRSPSKILRDIADLNDELTETAGTFTEAEAHSAEVLLKLCLENFAADGVDSHKEETA